MAVFGVWLRPRVGLKPFLHCSFTYLFHSNENLQYVFLLDVYF